uniref:CARD domain-containing protein n=1 Tax=Ciona savignyi TaxID=51511 RepID=H2ZA45_CIOSA
IFQNRKLLLSNLVYSDVILEELYSRGCLTERQYQVVKAQSIQLDKTQKILDVIQSTSFEGFLQFCEILSKDYPWLKEKLLQDAQELQKNKDQRTKTIDQCLQQNGGKIPSEKELMHLSRTLCKLEWESLLYELGCTSADIECIKQTNKTPSMQCMRGLVQWLRNEGDSATFKSLFDAINKAELNEHCVVEKFLEICTT